MICYRDKTFCINPECTCHEDNRFTKEVLERAKQWLPDPPIAVSYRCGDREPTEVEVTARYKQLIEEFNKIDLSSGTITIIKPPSQGHSMYEKRPVTSRIFKQFFNKE